MHVNFLLLILLLVCTVRTVHVSSPRQDAMYSDVKASRVEYKVYPLAAIGTILSLALERQSCIGIDCLLAFSSTFVKKISLIGP